MNRYQPEGKLLHNEKNLDYIGNAFSLNEAMMDNIILEARAIVCDKDHNLIVQLGSGIKGIIPREEGAIGIREGVTRDIALISRVNKAVCFVVEEIIKENGEVIAMLSRRKAQEICKSEYLDTLKEGTVVTGRITHIEPFGCFVDIGCGVCSLLPIDSISVSRISHPKDRFAVGEMIRAVVKTNENGRISLTHKELLGTWEENAKLFAAGQTVSGIIRSIESYGIFVELAPNLAGLAESFEGAKVGQHTSVYIKKLIPEKMKVKLIIIDCFEADYLPEKTTYFYNEDYIESWIYSPKVCTKEFRVDFAPTDKY